MGEEEDLCMLKSNAHLLAADQPNSSNFVCCSGRRGHSVVVMAGPGGDSFGGGKAAQALAGDLPPAAAAEAQPQTQICRPHRAGHQVGRLPGHRLAVPGRSAAFCNLVSALSLAQTPRLARFFLRALLAIS